ncbi:putative inorganic phosphate cotransporter [Manduca sexta]|uniref:putative inorganic phosphate cotransporter n=1 Tax=Manduca sexta TaxID=7130 RepID=UPI00188E5901|nr:putative inorganic phosphate cotransporter [Manduca sexta]
MVEEKRMSLKMLRREPGRLSVSAKKFGFGIRHVQMICMSFCMIALFIARSSLGVAILAMTDVTRRNDSNVEIYEWDKKTQGLILSSFFWGYMTMQIPAGLLAKRYGGKVILLVALLANGTISMILPIVASVGGWSMVCLCRVLMGLTQACLFPASHTLLGRWLPANERTTLTGIVYGGSQVGTIIAMPVSGILAETAMGWKLIFYSIAGLMFLTAAIWFWFSASSPEEHPMISEEEKYYIEMGLNMTTGQTKVNRPTPWREMFKTGPLWAIVVSHVGAATAFVLFFVDTPTYLERAMHISLRNSALLSALPYFGMWVGSVVSSTVCEKIYNRGLLSVTSCRKIFNSLAMFGAGAGLILLAYLGPDHKNIAIATLIGVLTMCGFTSAGFMVNHLDLSPHFAGVMLSLTNFAGSIGAVLTPVATSLILRNDSSDMSRWRIVFLMTAGLCVGSNIVYVIFGSAERQPWDNPDYKDRRKADPEEVRPVMTMNTKEDEKKKEAQA